MYHPKYWYIPQRQRALQILLNERGQSQKNIFSMILFILNVHNRQIYRDRRKTNGYLGQGGLVRNMGLLFGVMKLF